MDPDRCPACGRPVRDHPTYTLADYVAGITGQGPRILAAEVGRPKCEPQPAEAAHATQEPR